MKKLLTIAILMFSISQLQAETITTQKNISIPKSGNYKAVLRKGMGSSLDDILVARINGNRIVLQEGTGGPVRGQNVENGITLFQHITVPFEHNVYHSAIRTGMGFSKGDITVATVGGKRIVLQKGSGAGIPLPLAQYPKTEE